MRRLLLLGRRAGGPKVQVRRAPAGGRDSHKRHRSAFNLPFRRGAIGRGDPIRTPYGPDDAMLEFYQCLARKTLDAAPQRADEIVRSRSENRRGG